MRRSHPGGYILAFALICGCKTPPSEEGTANQSVERPTTVLEGRGPWQPEGKLEIWVEPNRLRIASPEDGIVEVPWNDGDITTPIEGLPADLGQAEGHSESKADLYVHPDVSRVALVRVLVGLVRNGIETFDFVVTRAGERTAVRFEAPRSAENCVPTPASAPLELDLVVQGSSEGVWVTGVPRLVARRPGEPICKAGPPDTEVLVAMRDAGFPRPGESAAKYMRRSEQDRWQPRPEVLTNTWAACPFPLESAAEELRAIADRTCEWNASKSYELTLWIGDQTPQQFVSLAAAATSPGCTVVSTLYEGSSKTLGSCQQPKTLPAVLATLADANVERDPFTTDDESVGGRMFPLAVSSVRVATTDADEIERSLRDRGLDLEVAYCVNETELALGSRLELSTSVEWIDGVAKLSNSRGIDDARVQRCLRAAIGRWNLSPLVSGTELRIDWSLRYRDPARRRPDPAPLSRKPIPSVRHGKPKVDGPLTNSDLRKVFRDHREAVESCYGRALIEHPSLAGLVELTFTVTADGRVLDAHAAAPMANEEIGPCVAAALTKWRFPSAETASTVAYPLILRVR